jgi:hypothetical protein
MVAGCSICGLVGCYIAHVCDRVYDHVVDHVLQVLAAHADNLSGEQSSACNTYAAALQ